MGEFHEMGQRAMGLFKIPDNLAGVCQQPQGGIIMKLNLTKPMESVTNGTAEPVTYVRAYKYGTVTYHLFLFGPNGHQISRTLPEYIVDEYVRNKKIKKEAWLNVYPNHEKAYVYSTKELADEGASNLRVACIHIEWEENVK